jgi:hypothetical protein
VSPKVRVRAAWALLVGSLVAWPAAALTVAKDEPPFILGLSFLAIVVTCLDVVSTQDVRKQQEGGE